MLVTLREILPRARREGYAVGAFNTANMEITQAIIEAAEEERSPVIIQTSEKAIEYAGLGVLFGMIKTLAMSTRVPIVIHLDHGKTISVIDEVMEAGYTSVMIDASQVPEEERIKVAKEVAAKAHAKGLSVEGERDQLRGKEDDVKGAEGKLTEPDEAFRFVKETGIDAFAVSIGNAHGKPLPNEQLDLNRLGRIAERVDIPLTLHGASSTPEPLIKKAISLGVAKINIDTDLRVAFTGALRDILSNHPEIYDPREELGPAREAVKQMVREKMKVFGSSGKAK
jgi:fructose-bisphosphate aldolase class II